MVETLQYFLHCDVLSFLFCLDVFPSPCLYKHVFSYDTSEHYIIIRQHYKESDQNGCKYTMKLLLEDTGQNALRLGNIYLDQLEDW